MSLFKFFTGMSITKKDFEEDEAKQDAEDAEAREKSYNDWIENMGGSVPKEKNQDDDIGHDHDIDIDYDIY